MARATISLTGGVIKNNVAAGSGGGGGIRSSGTTTSLTDVTISGNRAGQGGGLYLAGAQVTHNKTVGPNGQGAGIYIDIGTVNLTSGTQVTENLASGNFSQGGGIHMEGGTVNVNASSVSTNSVTGGIYNLAGTLSLTDATVTNNIAPDSPAPSGIYTTSAVVPAGTTTITSNTPTNCLLSPATVTGCVS